MTEIEIKQELSQILSGNPEWDDIEKEIDFFAITENLDGKSVLQKVYSQLKSGKKGHKNPFHSKTLYHLGITTKKPDKDFDTSGTRFFARPSAPDIDSDFDYERRDEIVSYLVAKYGREQVANVGTYGALKMRSALTRIIKALDIADAFHKGPGAFTTENMAKVDEILSTIPKQRGAVLKVKDKEGEEIVIKTTEDLMKVDSDACKDFRYYMQQHPDIYKHAKNIEGLSSIFGCVSKDTPVLTQKGWVRVDQLDRSCKIAYFDKDEEMQFTSKYIALETGHKQCYRMRLDDGNFVDLTDEHLVLTESGYVKFEEIRKNPELYKVCSIEV